MGRLTPAVVVTLAVVGLAAGCTGPAESSSEPPTLATPLLGPEFDIGGPGLADRLGPAAQSPPPVSPDAVGVVQFDLPRADYDDLVASGTPFGSKGLGTAHAGEHWAALLCDGSAGVTIEYAGPMSLGPVDVPCSGTADPSLVHLGTVPADTAGVEVTVMPTGPGTYLLYRLVVPVAG